MDASKSLSPCDSSGYRFPPRDFFFFSVTQFSFPFPEKRLSTADGRLIVKMLPNQHLCFLFVPTLSMTVGFAAHDK